MLEFQLLPLPFWLVVIAIVAFAIKSWRQRESSLRMPMLMVYFTVSMWYVGDALYNDYAGYQMVIDRASLENAWWEVLLFVCAFGFLAPKVHAYFNRKYLGKPSNLLSLVYYGGLQTERFQNQLDKICIVLLISWALLMTIGLFRTDFDFQGMFMPYLGDKVDPWERGRLGAGIDFLLALAGYFQIALCAAFGVVLALALRPLTWIPALIVTFLSLPTYIFDRTRSTFLATLLPGFLAWVFLRLRTGFIIKAVILVIGFLVVDSWLRFVIENRSGISISQAFYYGIQLERDDGAVEGHSGLNMFQELGYINCFIANGSYHPNWGERYFAELTNPIPRTLWPGKPMIGIDYAIARGQKVEEGKDDAGGVGATVSTGMIGQGVVNFGRILGPIAAALLMSCWATFLARQDLLASESLVRLLICALGLILTINMGRDITLLVLYPFFILYILFVLLPWIMSGRKAAPTATPRRVAPVNPALPASTAVTGASRR